MRAAGLALTVVVVVAGVWLAAGRNLALWERATSIVSMDDRSALDRLGVWDNSVSMFADHPLLGVGPGEWRTHVSGYGNRGLRSESGIIHFQRPHNDYLWVLTETGPFGLIAYLLVFASALVYAVRLLRSAVDRRQAWQVVALLYGLTGYMVVAFFSYPKERITHSVLLMLMLAMLTAAYHRTRPVRRRMTGRALAAASVAAAGILMLGLVAAFSRVSAEGHLGRAFRYREVGQWQRVIEEIDKARTFFMTMDPMSTPLAWYRGVAQFSLQRYEAALVDFQQAYRVNPTHLYVLNNLAAAHAVEGRHADAIRFYERALEISPRMDETLINLAAVYYNAGEYQKAFDRISQVSADSRDERFHTFLERIRLRLDEPAGDG